MNKRIHLIFNNAKERPHFAGYWFIKNDFEKDPIEKNLGLVVIEVQSYLEIYENKQDKENKATYYSKGCNSLNFSNKYTRYYLHE